MAKTSFDIFFSYNWNIQPFAMYLVTLLRELGFKVWFDTAINPSIAPCNMKHDMQESMRNGIKNATVFLCLLTDAYQKSTNCLFELDEADKEKKPIIVLVAEDKMKVATNWSVDTNSKAKFYNMWVDFAEEVNSTYWKEKKGVGRGYYTYWSKSWSTSATTFGTNSNKDFGR